MTKNISFVPAGKITTPLAACLGKDEGISGNPEWDDVFRTEFNSVVAAIDAMPDFRVALQL